MRRSYRRGSRRRIVRGRGRSISRRSRVRRRSSRRPLRIKIGYRK